MQLLKNTIRSHKTSTPYFVYALILYLIFLTSYHLTLSLNQPERLSTITQFNYPNTIRVNDRQGRLLYNIYSQENRFPIGIKQLPSHLIQAFLTTEDNDFYTHNGFSLKSIFRSLLHNLTHDTTQGGSTITQQLVKNKLLNNERSLIRKLKEVYLAVLVEQQYSKDQILEMYLNQINFGGVLYGVESASQAYFGKSASELNLSESIYLASLPQAPSRYTLSIYADLDNHARQQKIASQMLKQQRITESEYQHFLDTPLYTQKHILGINAPHFVEYLKPQILKQIASDPNRGYVVTSTLDLDIQKQAENILQTELLKLQRLNITNGAILVTKPTTGEIVAMVGSQDYFSTTIDGQVNLTTSLRQPGSSIKPINYALAIDRHGLKPWDFILDSPLSLPDNNSFWTPKNYDNRFHGLVSIRQALANSYNIPAVKLLIYNTPTDFINFANQLGLNNYNTLTPAVPSIALGSWETTMLDLSTAYSTFANGGYKIKPVSIMNISDADKQVVQMHQCPNTQIASLETSFIPNSCGLRVIDPATAFYISDILSDPVARSSAFGLHSTLNIPNHQVSVKTGTSNNMKDNWTIGYTKDWLVAVWVGNNDSSPMSHVASGITGASPIWSSTMSYLLSLSQTSAKISPPPNYLPVSVCKSFVNKVCVSKQIEYVSQNSTTTASFRL